MSELDLHDASGAEVPEDVAFGGVPPEASIADAVEQRTPVLEDAAELAEPTPDSVSDEAGPVEAEAADVLEQARPVATGEDDYR